MGSKAALLFMPKGNKIFIQTVSIFEYFGESINALQVNLCQKYLFSCQLTQNIAQHC